MAIISYDKYRRESLSILSALAVTVVSGCAHFDKVFNDYELLTSVALYKLTIDVIDERPEKAKKVKKYALEVMNLVDTDAETTVEVLDVYIHNRIDWTSLTPEDQLLTQALLKSIKTELTRRVGPHTIPPEHRVNVKKVMLWIAQAAETQIVEEILV